MSKCCFTVMDIFCFIPVSLLQSCVSGSAHWWSHCALFVLSLPSGKGFIKAVSVNWRLFSSLPLVDRSCACVLKPAPSSGCSGVKGLWWKRGRYSALAKLCKTFCVVFSCLVLQVLLPSSHASSWVWWLCEVRDWIQHLQGRWASP